MAAMMVEREPEVAKFIDSYKYDQDSMERRSKFGGGTSLPLDSDGYEDRQRKLKAELRKDFLAQQERDIDRPVNMNPYAPKHGPLAPGPQTAADYEYEIQKMTDRYHSKYNDTLFDADDKPSEPVYYRVGTPEQGLRGLGQYEQQRHEQNIIRQREYNAYLREQKNLELQRIEARNKRPPPPPADTQGGQLDYNQQNERARSEDKRAYQDYMGKYYQPNVVVVKPPINYEADKKRLSEERKEEYAQYMEKKAQEERYWKMRGRPVTPPGGLDIGHYDRHVKEKAAQKKTEYKEMLDQQKNEKLRHKAWERVAEVSPSHMHFRDEERPLVGSPRDVNFYMHEKEEKDKFGLINRELKPDTKSNAPLDKSSSTYKHHVARQLAKRDDENFKQYLEVEREKRKDQKKYREDLMKQQKEHMYLRARNEPEMPILDRSAPQQAQYLASKPPPGPQQASYQQTYPNRDEPPNRQTPNYWNDGKRERSPPVSESSKQSQSGKDNPVPMLPGPSKLSNPKLPRTGNSLSSRPTPAAFRTEPYVRHQRPEESRELAPHKDNPVINGYDDNEQQQPNLQSPQKSRRSPPEKRFDDFENQRTQQGSQLTSPLKRVDQGGYQPSFQGQGQRGLERPRQTPLAFQTGLSSRGFESKENFGRKSPPRDSQKPDIAPPRGNPAIGGLYVFDDSKHDQVKRQIYEMRQKDYQEFLQRKIENDRRRHDEARQNRGAAVELQKDHHYSSDEYEKFQKRLQKQEGDEYREFLKKQFEPKWKVGLPLGQYKYEPKRLLMEHERNADYNEYHRKTFQPTSNAVGLPLGQYKYEPNRLAMEAERNRDYNQYLKTKPKQPPKIDGPQGLNIDVTYQDQKKVLLEKERNKEYNALLKKEDAQNGYGPPGQIYDRYDQGNSMNKYFPVEQHPHLPDNHVEDRQSRGIVSPQRQSRTSHQQNSDNMQAVMNYTVPATSAPPEMHHVRFEQKINTSQQDGDSYIPESPGHAMNPYRTNPNQFYEQMTAPYPKALSVPNGYGSIPATPNKLSLPVGSYDEARPYIEKERNRQYNDFIAKLPPIKSSRVGMTPQATALTLPVGAYDAIRPSLERQRNEEYNRLKIEGKLEKRKGTLRQKAPTPPDQQGAFESQARYEGYRINMEKQRNREYNQFLEKKYAKGKMTSRSEPDRVTAPFFPGNEEEQEMKKRYLAQERSRQYNQMLREQEPPRSRSVNIPSDVDSGLPIGQQHHESYRKFLREQRNTEYNQMMDMKNQEVRNRDWSFGNSGVLDLRGDDENQSKKQVLREERKKEYNEYMTQNQKKSNRTWPEPDGRGALLVKKGEYDNVRSMYSNERKQELQQYLNKKDPQELRSFNNERRARSEPGTPSYNNNANPIVNNLGKYQDTRKKLVEDRKKEFQSFMAEKKAHEVEPKRGLQVSLPAIAKDEKPLVNSMGFYELETKKKFLHERRKDFAQFSKEQGKQWTPRNNVKENIMPHVASAETPLVNYMGHYDDEKQKFRVERNKDLREFSQKKKQEYHSPYENYVYPMVAVAEKPLVDYMGRDVEQRKNELREERRHDYERYQSKQRMRDAPRRHDYLDNRNAPYDGIFSGLGDHGNTKEVLGQQRRQEYNERLEQFPNAKAVGRPTFVRETLPNHTDRGRSPMRNPPPADHYQQMLDERRREEAQRRRFDDPEFQGRLAPGSRDGRYAGDTQQRYGGY